MNNYRPHAAVAFLGSVETDGIRAEVYLRGEQVGTVHMELEHWDQLRADVSRDHLRHWLMAISRDLFEREQSRVFGTEDPRKAA